MQETWLGTALEISEGKLWRVWPLALGKELLGDASHPSEAPNPPMYWVQVFELDNAYIVPNEGMFCLYRKGIVGCTQYASLDEALAWAGHV